MTSSSGSNAASSSSNWKAEMTAELMENLQENIFRILQEQLPDFARAGVGVLLMRTIRSWIEKFLHEVSDQIVYVERLSYCICTMFAQVEAYVIPLVMAEAANSTSLEQPAQTPSQGKHSDGTASLGYMMQRLELSSKSQTSEQGPTSQQSASDESATPQLFAGFQQHSLVKHETGESSTSRDVGLPLISEVQEILESDGKLGSMYEQLRLHFALEEVQHLRCRLPALVFAFTDLTLTILLKVQVLHRNLVRKQEPTEAYVDLASRVRYCIKEIVTPNQFLPVEFDDCRLGFLKLEVQNVIEIHKRLSDESFEAHRRLFPHL